MGSYWIILIYVALFAVIYLVMIRPNSKKKKQEQEMRNNIAIGDDITTIGGIVGRIVAIKDDEDAFIIETGSDRVKMKFKKWAISSVDTVKENAAPATKEDKLQQLKEMREKRKAERAEKKAAKKKEKEMQ